ncbi:ATP-binding protein [Verrucomicrobia bacterium]|nr:ATP-binding protein [Verrucomicrobiota bacterium]
MSLIEKFGERNPFDNLTVAGRVTAKFPLCGHEDQLDQRVVELLEAIDEADYPATAQHTIVFGEWGHGKTHVLRAFEHRINTERPQTAKAIFFEPTESKPEDIFRSLCEKLEISASNASEFISAVAEKFPHNLFLLIDETQAVVGEQLSDNLEKNLNEYWEFLGELQKQASNQLYGLHIFHGLSANSARAISKIGQLPSIREFRRHIFFLNPLTEEEQWEMFTGHLREGAGDQDLVPEDIIDRGVNRCLNELTGGNPRYSLVLMGQLFAKVKAQDADKIDGLICYHTLQETQRLDASSSNYFNKNKINQIINELKGGQQSEQKIANLLEHKMGSLLGEWSEIKQDELDRFGLTTATIRIVCNSLRQQPMPVFEQPPGVAEFRLRHEFLNTIDVIRANTISKEDDRALLLKLQLEPEIQIPNMMSGLRTIMMYNSHPGTLLDIRVLEIPSRLFLTRVSQGVPVHVGVNVYKGKEVPLELYEKILGPIEHEQFTVMLLIEDADTPHDRAGSSWQKFKDSYTGPLDLENRFVFINGTDPEGKIFDEDFFVKLAASSIQEDEAKDWFARLQIGQNLERIKEECVYCPAEDERVLVDELTKTRRSYTIGEIKDLQDSYHWVKRARLEKLDLYINKSGSAYEVSSIEKIRPIKFLLRILQESSEGLSLENIDKRLAAEFIRTGDNQAIQTHTAWLLDLLENQGKVKQVEGGLFFYKDLDREFQLLEEKYDDIKTNLESDISKYQTAGIDIAKLGQLKDDLTEIMDRIGIITLDPVEQQIPEYEIQNHALGNIQEQLGKVPDLARKELQGQLTELQDLHMEVMEQVTWSLDPENNPYVSLYKLEDIQNSINRIEERIADQIPQQRECRREIKSNKKMLNALNGLLGQSLSSNAYEGAGIDECIFRLLNAVRDEKSGIVTIHFS